MLSRSELRTHVGPLALVVLSALSGSSSLRGWLSAAELIFEERSPPGKLSLETGRDESASLSWTSRARESWSGAQGLETPRLPLLTRSPRIDAGRSRSGDGDVAGLVPRLDLTAIQFIYADLPCGVIPDVCDEGCNGVQLQWSESRPLEGIELLVDDVSVAIVDPLPPSDIPGRNFVNVPALLAGSHTLTIREIGPEPAAEESVVFEVLDSPPFAPASNLTCAPGAADGDGTCVMNISYENGEELPEGFIVVVDGNQLGFLDSMALAFPIAEVPIGEHCVTLIGQLAVDGNRYQGCGVMSCCEIACEQAACNPPFDIDICQIAYGAEPGTSAVRALLNLPAGGYPGGLNVYIDGELIGQAAGDSTNLTLGLLDTGLHSFGFQGDCGKEIGTSEIVEVEVEVLAESPHANPIESIGACVFVDGDPPMTTVEWVNADPSTAIDILIFSGGQLFYLGRAAGSLETISVNNTTEDDQIVLQFLTEVDGVCYGSELVGCTTPPPAGGFIPGICNGSDRFDISSPIFALSFLFLGATAPDCRAACDTNGDGAFDVSDSVYALAFLFSGGPAPVGWIDDAPACITESELPCEVQNPACSQ